MKGGVPVAGVGSATSEDGEKSRHATWLELFFDLVFVVAIAELTHGFVAHPDAQHAVLFVLLFVPTYLVWLNVSYYADLFDTDDLRSRAVLFLAMLGGVVLATGIEPAIEGDATVFVLAYLGLRLFLLGLYLRVAVTLPSIRGFAGRFAGGYAIGAVLWAVSLAVPEPTRFWIWIVAVVVEGLTPAVAYTTAAAPNQESHMPERFGLFTIVALGETIVAVVAGLTDTVWTATTVAVALLSFGLAVTLWWLYFDRLDESVTTRSVRGDRRALLGGLGYSYGHYAITFGVAATGVGATLVLESTGADAMGAGPVVLLAGVGTYLVGTGLAFGVVDVLTRWAVATRLAVTAVFVIVLLLAPWIPAAATLAFVTATLVATVLVERRLIGALPASA